jgi:cobalamin biosynthesis protein CobD/CbiB
MRSHLLHMVLYSFVVATFLALVFRHDLRARFRFGVTTWLVMVGGAMALAYLMYPFPG